MLSFVHQFLFDRQSVAPIMAPAWKTLNHCGGCFAVRLICFNCFFFFLFESFFRCWPLLLSRSLLLWRASNCNLIPITFPRVLVCTRAHKLRAVSASYAEQKSKELAKKGAKERMKRRSENCCRELITSHAMWMTLKIRMYTFRIGTLAPRHTENAVFMSVCLLVGRSAGWCFSMKNDKRYHDTYTHSPITRNALSLCLSLPLSLFICFVWLFIFEFRVPFLWFSGEFISMFSRISIQIHWTNECHTFSHDKRLRMQRGCILFAIAICLHTANPMVMQI